MGQITLDQSHQVLATLAVNADWTTIDFANSGLQDSIVCNPKEAGRQFTAFLKNGGKVIVGGTRVIPITRGRFNPAKFIGNDWSIIADETDARSVALTELDIAKVHLVTMLAEDETHIKGEEKLKRLKVSDYIRLDADIFLTFWENQHFIPESWKEKVNGSIRYIFFDGTILRGSDGNRYILYLYWRDGGWYWSCNWLVSGWGDGDPSVVLAR